MAKILVADTDPEYRRVVSRVLSDAGYDVWEARNEDETVRSVWEHTPDLLVVDVRLPPRGGLDAVERIRDCAWALPFILTSSSPFCDEGFRIWYADACVRKSRDALDLRRAVKRILDPCGPGSPHRYGGREVLL